MGQHGLGHAHVLQRAHDLAIDHDGAGFAVHFGAAVDGQGAKAGLPQHAGGDGPRRAEAHHDYVEVGDVEVGHAGTNPMASCARLTASLLGGAIPQWSVRPGGHVQSAGPPTR